MNDQCYLIRVLTETKYSKKLYNRSVSVGWSIGGGGGGGEGGGGGGGAIADFKLRVFKAPGCENVRPRHEHVKQEMRE